MMKLGWIVLISFLLSACGEDAHHHPQLTSGKELFEYHCASCHKQNGKGNFLKGVPANIGTSLEQWQLMHKIKQGEKNSKMPVFKSMSQSEARKIANYIAAKSH